MRVFLWVILAASSLSFGCNKTDDPKKSSSSSSDKSSDDDKSDKGTKDKKKKSSGDDDDDDGACAASFASSSKNKGNEFKFKCPADCPTNGAVYGTGWYTTDSLICVAAIHAGAIKAAKGGEVTLKAHKGLKNYRGTKANGVTSTDWGSYGDSYSINGGEDGNLTPKKGDKIPVTCTDSVKDVGSDGGDDFKVTCPPGCIDKGGSVWGTGKYTTDSSICKAAVHAGVITDDDGGDVHVKVVDGLDKYQGSKKHGVTTDDYGSYEKSFTVE